MFERSEGAAVDEDDAAVPRALGPSEDAGAGSVSPRALGPSGDAGAKASSLVVPAVVREALGGTLGFRLREDRDRLVDVLEERFPKLASLTDIPLGGSG